MTNSNVCQVCGGKPSDRRLVTTVLNSEGKQIMKDTLKCLNSFHDGYGFTDQLPNEPKRNFTESIFNKPTPTSVEEQIEALSTNHMEGGERMDDGSLQITHNWTTLKPAILKLIEAERIEGGIAELTKLQDRAYIDESFDYYNANDWESAIFDRLAELRKEQTGRS